MKIEKACTGAALDGVQVQSETMTALPFLTSVLAFPTETQRVKDPGCNVMLDGVQTAVRVDV